MAMAEAEAEGTVLLLLGFRVLTIRPVIVCLGIGLAQVRALRLDDGRRYAIAPRSGLRPRITVLGIRVAAAVVAVLVLVLALALVPVLVLEAWLCEPHPSGTYTTTINNGAK